MFFQPVFWGFFGSNEEQLSVYISKQAIYLSICLFRFLFSRLVLPSFLLLFQPQTLTKKHSVEDCKANNLSTPAPSAITIWYHSIQTFSSTLL